MDNTCLLSRVHDNLQPTDLDDVPIIAAVGLRVSIA